MTKKALTSEKINLEIDTTGMSDQQIRLIKTANSLLTHIMSAEVEEEYFESSSDLFRVIATAIKTSNFNTSENEIAYDQQVLEYCSDTLADQVYQDDIIQYDN